MKLEDMEPSPAFRGVMYGIGFGVMVFLSMWMPS